MEEFFHARQHFDFENEDESSGSSFFERHIDSPSSLEYMENLAQKQNGFSGENKQENVPLKNRIKTVPKPKPRLSNQGVSNKISIPASRRSKRLSHTATTSNPAATFAAPKKVQGKKKLTQPKTPQCLKRSQNRPLKIVKTTEQRELEHIEELRKKTAQNILINKQNMRKIRGSAMKPILLPRNVSNKPKTAPKPFPMIKRRETVAVKDRFLKKPLPAKPNVFKPNFDIPSFNFADGKTSTPYVFKTKLNDGAGPSQPEKMYTLTKASKKDKSQIDFSQRMNKTAYSGMFLDFNNQREAPGNRSKRVLGTKVNVVNPQEETANSIANTNRITRSMIKGKAINLPHVAILVKKKGKRGFENSLKEAKSVALKKQRLS